MTKEDEDELGRGRSTISSSLRPGWGVERRARTLRQHEAKFQSLGAFLFSLIHDKDGLDLTQMFYTSASFVSVLCNPERVAASAEERDARQTNDDRERKSALLYFPSYRPLSSPLLSFLCYGSLTIVRCTSISLRIDSLFSTLFLFILRHSSRLPYFYSSFRILYYRLHRFHLSLSIASYRLHHFYSSRCVAFYPFLLFVSPWSCSVACKTAYLSHSGRT